MKLSRVGLTIAVVLAASILTSASAFEKVLYAFRGAPGGCPIGGLTSDGLGNFYGSTRGCGETDPTVFEMSPNDDGTWTIVTLFDELVSSSLTFGPDGNLYATSSVGLDDPGRIIQLVHEANGQWTENVLFSFGGYNGDGLRPSAGVAFDASGNLYGTTLSGGANGMGTVFELSPSANGVWSEFVLKSFSGIDGSTPLGGVVIDSGGNLYGTSSQGGSQNRGIVFELTPSNGGWIETVLHFFGNRSGTDGWDPMSGLAFDSAGNLYGTTYFGGLGYGTVFKLAPINGSWNETVIHKFNPANGDGTNPSTPLVINPAGNLYGVVTLGGRYNVGVAFRLVVNSRSQWVESGQYTFLGGRNGGYPVGSLTFGLDGGIFGATNSGGLSGCGGYPAGCGTIFEIK